MSKLEMIPDGYQWFESKRKGVLYWFWYRFLELAFIADSVFIAWLLNEYLSGIISLFFYAVAFISTAFFVAARFREWETERWLRYNNIDREVMKERVEEDYYGLG